MNKFLTKLLEVNGRGEGFTGHCISWNLSPKINATFRNGDVELVKQMFYAMVDEGDIDDAVKMVAKCHKEQGIKVKSAIEQMQDGKLLQYKNSVVGIIDNDYAPYSGLIAGRLCGQYNKPAFVLRKATFTSFSGSCRSSTPILELVNSSGMMSGQGHDEAFGVLVSADKANRFFKWLDKQDVDIQSTRQVAAELTTADITLDLCEQLEQCDYLWCNDLVKPQFLVKFDIQPGEQCLCGKAGNTFKYGPYLKFRCNEDEVGKLSANEPKFIEAIVELSVNEYNGARYPQARIVDWEITTKASNPILDFDSIFN